MKKNDLTKLTRKKLLEYIRSIDLEKDAKLPREETLAKEMGVSRITLRSALKELAAEGIIFSKQGKGTFVNKEAIYLKTNFNPIADLREVLKEKGFTVKVNTVGLKIRAATPDEEEKLGIKKGDKVFVLDRLFYANDAPTVYCIDRIPLELFKKDISYEDSNISIFAYIKDVLGRQITWDKVEISTFVDSKKPFLQSYFQLKEPKAFLNCDIIHYDDTDTPVLYSNEYIDTDYIRFNQIRQKNL